MWNVGLSGSPSIESLLGRGIMDVGRGDHAAYLGEATVLVTGAGGSIGSELCARLAGLGPRELVLVDQAEAPLVGITRVLHQDLGFTSCTPVLADLKIRTRALQLLDRYRPDVVIHAAAYKHVPLLEEYPVEGVATNVLGTKNLLEASRSTGVGRFVLFSSDKAVAPASVLGRTKRVAEWLVADTGRGSDGRYAVVRLGNVIDSSGSIVPIFRRQVADGGPLTVTDSRATRYLMTADEAAGLAIAAGALADSESVFFLDTGPPVPVVDLARRVAATAARPVEVQLIGLRPGERLHEYMFWPGDDVVVTPCDNVLRVPLHRVEPSWLNGWLAMLARYVEQASAAGVRATLLQMEQIPELSEARPTRVTA